MLAIIIIFFLPRKTSFQRAANTKHRAKYLCVKRTAIVNYAFTLVLMYFFLNFSAVFEKNGTPVVIYKPSSSQKRFSYTMIYHAVLKLKRTRPSGPPESRKSLFIIHFLIGLLYVFVHYKEFPLQ
jgi:hypothetical protein